MHKEISDLIVCYFDKSDEHILKDPRILSCGHTFCFTCLNNDYSQNHCIRCTFCGPQETDRPDELIVNQFIYGILSTFPQLFEKILTDHKSKNETLTQISASKFDEFFEYQFEEIEIRYFSILSDIDSIESSVLSSVDRIESNFRKINRGYKEVDKYLKSSSPFYDDDYSNCERLFKLGLKMQKNKDYFHEDVDTTLLPNNKIIKFIDNLKLNIPSKHFGNIKTTLNLNVQRFKNKKIKVYEFSSQNLNSIGGICKLDEEKFVATNPSINSLVVFDQTFNIIKSVTNIMQTRFNYPMAICSNNLDSIYVCDCHNLRVLILNKDLNVIKTTLSTSYNPSDICFDSNFLYILYSERKSIHKFTSDGTLLTRLELKPLLLYGHSEIDPMRFVVQNTKVVGLYSNKKVFIHDINEESKLVDNPRQIKHNSSINAICFSSPSLLTIHNDGQIYFHDIVNQYSDQKEYQIVHESSIDIFSRAIPCFVNYFDESLFITFQNPKSHWLMKIDIR